ncbi:MAG: glutathione S-transferase family protein [Gammaproteobacteria bacterium]|nr:MAG: glutathione S-transferase family protein [Gammaproteobacteria bacterium]
MLKLHGISLSNYTNMVKQCLIEKGIEFEQVDARPSQDDDFLIKSPMGKIPCLETPDGFLIETAAILDYLEDVYPTPAMYPTDAFAKAKAREIMHVAELYIEVAARRHLGATFFGGERSEDAMTEVRPQVEKGLHAVTQLADFGPYVMGSDFGNVDIFVYHSFRLARMILKRTYDWDITSAVPGFDTYLAAMDERDSTKSVVAENEKAMAALIK